MKPFFGSTTKTSPSRWTPSDFADELQFVDQHRDVEPLRLRLGGRGIARVLRVDHVEEDALVLVGRPELLKLGSGDLRESGRAIDLAHQDDRFGVLEVVQLVRETGVVRQLEVVDAVRDVGGRGRRRGRRRRNR